MSTIKRIVAILCIFVVTTIAWLLLGATIFERTNDQDLSLRSKVASNWGATQEQAAPSASYFRLTTLPEVYEEGGKQKVKTVTKREDIFLPLDSTRANVGLQLEYRPKGLLWYSTYRVDFSGEYTFHNPARQAQEVEFVFPFPAEQANYDNVTFSLNGKPQEVRNEGNSARANMSVAAGETFALKVTYISQGLTAWHYKFGDQVSQVRDFHLTMSTNFRDIDFPDNTLSPTEKEQTPDGWRLQWSYKNLLSGYKIGMTMPEKLQPGPLAGRISLFAPVSLFFFFFLVFIITTIRGADLHPMNYFFLAAAFFAFHLLMAYLVDHISIHYAFVIASLVSLGLVVSYMRLVAGLRFALLECGLAQFVYLVLFSYAFFFKGFTGLAVTIGSIVTLFVVMQMTGRINWAEKFVGSQRHPVRGNASS
jgi:inner membrane protein involved in colicin E2 resistance